ncbi:MAG: hypothetical protein OEZ13_04990 [Spirochaetia bacterium]|nr:hypothetical protein [Spirochaetia bacterium]
MVKWNKKRIILLSGAAFSLAGLIILIYISFFFRPSGMGWNILVKGNKHIQENEIKETVLYLLRTLPDGASASDIEKALMFNPRITHAAVKIRPGKLIQVEIIENETGYLVHINLNKKTILAEYDLKDLLMAESDLSENNRELDSRLPIFYLTVPKENKNYAENIRRDIIQLWARTKEDYGFIWERISEIEITAVSRKKPGFFIYTAAARARIFTQIPLKEDFMERLWAVMYMLEKIDKTKWYTIEIHYDHALVREA